MRGVAQHDQTIAVPVTQGDVAIARARQLVRVDRIGQTGIRLGPQAGDLVAPCRQSARTPAIEVGNGQTPEEAQTRRVVAGARTYRQQADHLARGDVALPQFVAPRPVALRHQTPKRAPGIHRLALHRASGAAQARGRSVRCDHQVERTVPAAVRITNAAGVVADGIDRVAGVEHTLPRPRIRQQREQRATLHAQAEQARIQTAVPHVHHGATARRFAVQAIDPSAMRQHVGQQAQFPQHLQAGRLQQETCADRTRFRRTFEDLHPVPVAREQQRGGLAGGAVSDDGDVQRFHSGDFSVAPAQGSGMQALKNPAGAGFKKIVLDQAAGVMLDACAPFGPWVSS